MNTALHYEIARQVHADVIREARRHALAKVPPQERRAPRRLTALLQAVRAVPAPSLRPAAEPG